jgi:hypothetical protein
MNAYERLDPRIVSQKLKKTIQKLESEVTEIDPTILEINQLTQQIAQIKSEIEQIELKWLDGIGNDDHIQININQQKQLELINIQLEKLEEKKS